MAIPPLLCTHLSLLTELLDSSAPALLCHILGLTLEAASLYWHLTGYWSVTFIIIIIIIIIIIMLCDLVVLFFVFCFLWFVLVCVLYLCVHGGFTFGHYAVELLHKYEFIIIIIIWFFVHVFYLCSGGGFIFGHYAID
jgi:hypothetical protein